MLFNLDSIFFILFKESKPIPLRMISKDACLLFLYYILYAEDSRSIEMKLENEISKSSINQLNTYMMGIVYKC